MNAKSRAKKTNASPDKKKTKSVLATFKQATQVFKPAEEEEKKETLASLAAKYRAGLEQEEAKRKTEMEEKERAAAAALTAPAVDSGSQTTDGNLKSSVAGKKKRARFPAFMKKRGKKDERAGPRASVTLDTFGTSGHAEPGSRSFPETRLDLGESSGTEEVNIDGPEENTVHVNLRKEDSGLYFNDGLRKIDFILVYEEQVETKKSVSATEERIKKWRQKFFNNLKKAGLHIEEEMVENDKKLITFIKLHAPWDVCCAYAESLSIRAPLQVVPDSKAHPNPTSNWSSKFLETFHIPNMMDQVVPNMPLDYYTCQFKTSKLERFLGSENPDTFFEDIHRHRILWEILSTTIYGKKKRAEIGVERLMDEHGLVAAFPLHDGSHKNHDRNAKPETLNKRQVLYKYWARWGCWYKYQPLDHIREYFGEKIGIYFAWLGFYTAWLLPASIVGVLVFLYGLITFNDNIPAKEICDSNKDYKMCPVCDEDIGCEYWYLSDVCLFVKIAYLFDHPGTVFYAVFVSFWAVTFLEYWKRKNASLAHHWDCLDFEEEEERPRPDYAARAPELKENPITGINEPYFDPSKRFPRILSGIAAIVIMMCLVLIFIIAVIMYRVLISIPLFENENLRARASTIASMTAAVVNLIIIMTLGKVYEKLAYKLTQWEMHRTQTEFEDQLTFKVFIFQFVNFYSSIIYVAFFKGKFVGYPGNYNRFFGLRSEECNNGGCLVELAQQLGVIMIGKQIINNAQEIILPKLKGFWHRLNTRFDKKVQRSRWEDDYELIENEGLFQEYLEMILQFGFITIFVAAFPLAPLFALLNNWVEIRLDAHKFVCETRRPVAERAQDIGVWFTILETLAQLAVISNAFLIAFTSEFLPRLMYQYQYQWSLDGYTNFTLAEAPNNTLREPCRYRDYREPDGNHTMFYWKLLAVRLAFVIVFEHVVFGICKMIDILVPDIPETLELKIKRERYLAKQALADTDTLLMMARRNELEEDDVDLNVRKTPSPKTSAA
ncbi:anoctamin-7-like isoform X2 [Physella acuta]|uniref:anoctamin-7-like isoform X2 n=1 Tax=Physella acuta TaxID=109671 RepID=UPI0027DAF675|nr:anoctamin-7-like isoform X2 [Physella acuta]